MSKRRSPLLIIVSVVSIASLITCCVCVPCGLLSLSGYETATPVPEARFLPEPGPTEVPWEPVEIVSERELTADEFFQAVEGDESFTDVYALAAEQGYTEPQGGGEFVASNGAVVQGLLLASADEQLVVALHFEGDEGSDALLARVEAESETLILYDRDGRAEISERGITVFDAAGDPIGETRSSRRVQSSGAASPRRQCEGPQPDEYSWEDFEDCTRRYSGAGWSAIKGCIGAAVSGFVGIGFASAVALPYVCVGAIVAAIVGCGVPDTCRIAAMQDDPPTYDIRRPEPWQQPCRVECVDLGDRTAKLTIQNYRFQVHVNDDRDESLASPIYREVCAGDTFYLTIQDCAGHQVPVPLVAPGRDNQPLEDCLEGERCVQVDDDNAECRSGQPPAPVPPPTDTPEPAAPQISVWINGQLMEEGRYESELLMVVIDERIWFKWEVQNADRVQLDGELVGDKGERRVYLDVVEEEWTYTIVAEGPGGRKSRTDTWVLWWVERE